MVLMVTEFTVILIRTIYSNKWESKVRISWNRKCVTATLKWSLYTESIRITISKYFNGCLCLRHYYCKYHLEYLVVVVVGFFVVFQEKQKFLHIWYIYKTLCVMDFRRTGLKWILYFFLFFFSKLVYQESHKLLYYVYRMTKLLNWGSWYSRGIWLKEFG